VTNYEQMVQKLKSLSAYGGAEDAIPEKVELGFQMWETFHAGRSLQRVWIGPIVPWLLRKNTNTKFWLEHMSVPPPFQDHCREFVDRKTKQRVATIQPYFARVAGEVGVDVPQEFNDHFNKEIDPVTRRTTTYRPLPQTPVFQETIAAVVSAAQQRSDEFAQQYGLQAEVSFNGWYNPERVILIEYRKAN